MANGLDPRIALQTQVGNQLIDLSRPGELFINSLLTARRGAREAELQPVRQRLLEAQATGAEQTTQQQAQQNQLRAEALTARDIRARLDAGDDVGVAGILGTNPHGISPEALAQADNLFQNAPDQFSAVIDDRIRAGQQAGVFGKQGQKFIGTPQRITKKVDGRDQNFLVGVVQRPDGSFSEEEVPIEGKFVSTLGETAAQQQERKLSTEQQLNKIIADRQKGKTLATGEADRLSGFIQQGITAVDQLPNIKRGLELLKSVRTGGITAKAKVVSDFFGTTSGDVAELNKILATNVLNALSNFTGAISEGERLFLERMETSLASGAEFNVRELNRMDKLLTKQITRAKRAARATGDEFSLEILNEPIEVSGFGQAATTTPAAPQTPATTPQTPASTPAQPLNIGRFQVETVP